MPVVQYVSDLHLEFHCVEVAKRIAGRIIPKADILVLLGDIGNPCMLNGHYRIFLETVSPKFKKIFIIAGNHEYYSQCSMDQIRRTIQTICASLSNVSFLDNTFEDYGGIRWIGTTLWSNVELETPYEINDTRQICQLDTAGYLQLHYEAKAFLETTLQDSQAENRQCVVLTHHLPSLDLIHARYRTGDMEPYNQWFASNLNELIKQYRKSLAGWFYGHTHLPHLGKIHSVIFACNPLGYSGENQYYNYEKVVEI